MERFFEKYENSLIDGYSKNDLEKLFKENRDSFNGLKNFYSLSGERTDDGGLETYKIDLYKLGVDVRLPYDKEKKVRNIAVMIHKNQATDDKINVKCEIEDPRVIGSEYDETKEYGKMNGEINLEPGVTVLSYDENGSDFLSTAIIHEILKSVPKLSEQERRKNMQQKMDLFVENIKEIFGFSKNQETRALAKSEESIKYIPEIGYLHLLCSDGYRMRVLEIKRNEKLNTYSLVLHGYNSKTGESLDGENVIIDDIGIEEKSNVEEAIRTFFTAIDKNVENLEIGNVNDFSTWKFIKEQ